MSEHRRPAERFATALDLPELALFVHTRQLVLETDPDAIAELEKASGLSKVAAMQYFLHVYEWPREMKEFLAGPTVGLEQKEEIVRKYLAQTIGVPLLRPLPES